MTETSRLEVTTVGDLLLLAADRAPDVEALVFPEVRLRYEQLAERALRRARSLHSLGVRSGQHVGILMPNCAEYVELLIAIQWLGAVAIPMNARYKAAELAYVVENANLDLLVTTDRVADFVDFAALLAAGLPGLADAADPHALALDAAPRLRSVVQFGATAPPGTLSQETFEAVAEDTSSDAVHRLRERVRLRDPAILMYTSGTTANPRGCPLCHEALVRSGRSMRNRYRLEADDRFWDPLPFFHMSTILPMLAVFDAGAAFLAMTHFEAGEALKMLQDECATVAFPSFPTLTLEMIHHPDFDSTDLSRLRVVNNVAPPDTLRQMQAAYPHAIQVSAYGLTEVTGVISWNELDDTPEQRATTCGRPLPGVEVRIVDPETREELPAGQRGEMTVRGYCLFEGYYRDPEKNAEAFDADGWLSTGDLCSLTPEGRIVFHGRIKDMLKVGGENVAALEIEAYLGTHPAVELAQVVGVADARLVEVPAAFVKLRAGQVAEADELIKFCRGQIASFKIPRYVRFVDEWPMSATKVQKFRLRESIERELTS